MANNSIHSIHSIFHFFHHLLGLPLLTYLYSSWETVYIVFVSTFISVILGLGLGLILFYESNYKHRFQKKIILKFISLITNIIRSIPFIILLFALIPFTRWIIGTSIGNNAAIVPLIIGAIPFFARIAESAFLSVPKNKLELAKSIGANLVQTIFKILIPEALPNLIKGATLTAILLIGYSAMSGIVGGGGLGALAYNYGYEQDMWRVVWVTIILLIILVQLIQSYGDWLAKTRKLKSLFILSLFLILASAYSQISPYLYASNKNHNTLKIGIMAGVQQKIMIVAKQYALKHFNLNLKFIAFSNYSIPNIALNSREIDANIFQHIPFLNSQIKAHGYQLHPIAKTFVYPFGFYSIKIHHLNLNHLKPHSKVAIPNDPTNEGRALRLLQKAGLIILKPKNSLLNTPLNIISNPLHLKIIPMAAAQIPHALKDVVLAGLTNSFAKLSGFKLNQALIKESKNSPYANVIVIHNHPNIWKKKLFKELILTLHSKPVLNKTLKVYPYGAAVKAW